jgi:hypothetical protein
LQRNDQRESADSLPGGLWNDSAKSASDEWTAAICVEQVFIGAFMTMKIASAVRGSAVLLLALCVDGCSLFQPKTGERQAVVGTWQNTVGTIWTLKANGTFDVDLNHNGQRDGWGKYTVSGSTLTLWRTGGISPRRCDGDGVYRFTRDKNTLRFALVSDDCNVRRKNMLLSWTLK